MSTTICASAGDSSPFAASCREPGSIVTFGTYSQTEDGSDQTPIEWIVLDYDEADHKALLLSRYGLEAAPYHTEQTDITWEQSPQPPSV